MTQEEVDLIYDYLHENYEYVDGDLIRIKTGKKIGSINMRKGWLHVNCMLRLNGRNYNFSQQSLIYLFHKKTKLMYFDFKDNNPMNFKIENLIPRNTRRLSGLNENAKYVCKLGSIFQSYFCLNSKRYHIGSYLTYEFASKISQEALSLLSTQEPQEIISFLRLKYPSNRRENARSLPNNVHRNVNTYYFKFMKKGKIIYRAGFKTPEEAHEAYLKAKAGYAQT